MHACVRALTDAAGGVVTRQLEGIESGGEVMCVRAYVCVSARASVRYQAASPGLWCAVLALGVRSLGGGWPAVGSYRHTRGCCVM